jgi:hypothetical protein
VGSVVNLRSRPIRGSRSKRRGTSIHAAMGNAGEENKGLHPLIAEDWCFLFQYYGNPN